MMATMKCASCVELSHNSNAMLAFGSPLKNGYRLHEFGWMNLLSGDTDRTAENLVVERRLMRAPMMELK